MFEDINIERTVNGIMWGGLPPQVSLAPPLSDATFMKVSMMNL